MLVENTTRNMCAGGKTYKLIKINPIFHRGVLRTRNVFRTWSLIFSIGNIHLEVLTFVLCNYVTVKIFLNQIGAPSAQWQRFQNHPSELFLLIDIKSCQAQPKVQTKASAFGWDGYNIIIIQQSTHPPTHQTGQVWRRRDRAKLRKRKLFVCMSRP